MKLGQFARKYATSRPTDAAIPAIPAIDRGRQAGTLAEIATIAGLADRETRSPGISGRVSTLGRDGWLHPRLARLIQAFAARHLFTDGEHEEAVRVAETAADPATCWRFYEDADRDRDDRISCRLCARLAGARCGAKGFAPVLDIPRRCGVYEPLQGDPDRRDGADRWPGLE